MRIIAGKLGGRSFDTPAGHRTHPMSEKGRGGLFNSLGDIAGLTVLDAFAGSGGLAFEALSRGASQATLVESDRLAHEVIVRNSRALGLAQRAKVTRANVGSWSERNPEALFDIVLCDPPYDHLQEPILQKLAAHVAAQGIYVLSWPGKQTPLELPTLRIIKTLNYGDAQLIFFRRST